MYWELNKLDGKISYTKTDCNYFFEHQNFRLLIDSPWIDDRIEKVSSTLVSLIQQVSNKTLTNEWMSNLLGGHYSIVIWNIVSREVWLLRDIAGAKPLYYLISETKISVSNQLVDIKVNKSLDIQSIRRKKTLHYFEDGDTFYNDIKGVKMGEVVYVKEDLEPVSLFKFGLNLLRQDNEYNTRDNVYRLRDKILAAHEKFAGDSNIIMLSGGIDSSVMLASLKEITTAHMDLRAVTFRLKGTKEDETPYANRLASNLGVEIETIEVDPNSKAIVEKFQRDVSQMNSPYHGALIYGYLPGGKDCNYFAGQDSRLHTPDVNRLDMFLFDLLNLFNFKGIINRKSFYFTPYKLTRDLSRSRYRSIRGIDRAMNFMDPIVYIGQYMLGIDREDLFGILNERELFEDKITSPRDLYNQITRFRWSTQFVSDMQYLQDMARLNSTKMCLPFYELSLARFSSGLPFKEACEFSKGTSGFDSSRIVKVNKRFLREAFIKELPYDLATRNKAVSRTMYLLFNGPLGNYIRNLIEKDIQREFSFSVALGYEVPVKYFLSKRNFVPSDENQLTEIFQLACILQKSE